MSGHSKWKNIMHKKEKTDAQRAKIFTKIGREMSVIVKQGGPDPNVNSKLKDCIAKAKSLNVPNDNIERIIKKASGESILSFARLMALMTPFTGRSFSSTLQRCIAAIIACLAGFGIFFGVRKKIRNNY